jgi:hypothetical protein
VGAQLKEPSLGKLKALAKVLEVRSEALSGKADLGGRSR